MQESITANRLVLKFCCKLACVLKLGIMFAWFELSLRVAWHTTVVWHTLHLSKLFQCVLLCTPVRAVERLNFCSISAKSSQRVLLLLLSLSISHSLRYDNYSTCNSSRPIKNRDSLVQQVKYFIYQVVEYTYKDKFNESIATNTTEMAFLMKNLPL